jgi:mercuric reductase
VHAATALTAVRRDGHGYTLAASRGGTPAEPRAGQLLIAAGRRPVTTGTATTACARSCRRDT